MTKLKSVLETLEGLDEALKAFYTEKDGKFYLNIEGIDDHADVKALKNTMQRAKQEKRDAETKLAELEAKYASLPDDFTVDEYHNLKDAGTGRVDQRLADQKDRLTKAFETEKRILQDKIEVATRRADKLASENALNAAISEANITIPAMQKAVRSMFQGRVKVEYEGDEPVITIDNLPVAEKIKAYASTEEGKYFVSAPGNGGGGSGGQGSGGGNTSDNPWSEKSWNLTKQIQITNDDPTKAESLKRAAGIK